jgi:hypothetical protein
MDESSGGATRDPATPAPPRWRGIQSLDLVYQLNERCFELLHDVASNDDLDIELPIISENRELWVRLSIEARRAASQMPFMVVDVRFKDETWWRRIADGKRRDVEAQEAFNKLPGEVCEQLMHETIMFAWQTARWDRTVARLALAMSPPVVDVIAGLTPQQVRVIATHESNAIGVRWEDDLEFWRDMLIAANAGNVRRLAELHLHAKLLLCAELAQLRPDRL